MACAVARTHQPMSICTIFSRKGVPSNCPVGKNARTEPRLPGNKSKNVRGPSHAPVRLPFPRRPDIYVSRLKEPAHVTTLYSVLRYGLCSGETAQAVIAQSESTWPRWHMMILRCSPASKQEPIACTARTSARRVPRVRKGVLLLLLLLLLLLAQNKHATS